MKNKTLVVYFSYSNGNTRHIAELDAWLSSLNG